MGKYKNVIQNDTFKIPAPTLNDIFEKLNVLYPISDLQGYFEYSIKI